VCLCVCERDGGFGVEIGCREVEGRVYV
jgi:hypothetical protein